ncbi:hypothetical protein FQR65_LT20157 [Abscondita terminalis]|nr:hypothetical protein FQR65_LT20157 [Abscondita terminalis]
MPGIAVSGVKSVAKRRIVADKLQGWAFEAAHDLVKDCALAGLPGHLSRAASKVVGMTAEQGFPVLAVALQQGFLGARAAVWRMAPINGEIDAWHIVRQPRQRGMARCLQARAECRPADRENPGCRSWTNCRPIGPRRLPGCRFAGDDQVSVCARVLPTVLDSGNGLAIGNPLKPWPNGQWHADLLSARFDNAVANRRDGISGASNWMHGIAPVFVSHLKQATLCDPVGKSGKGGALLPIEEALQRLLAMAEAAPILERERLPLAAIEGRVLAEELAFRLWICRLAAKCHGCDMPCVCVTWRGVSLWGGGIPWVRRIGGGTAVRVAVAVHWRRIAGSLARCWDLDKISTEPGTALRVGCGVWAVKCWMPGIVVRDDLIRYPQCLAELPDVDLILSTGGVSVGEADFLGALSLREEGRTDVVEVGDQARKACSPSGIFVGVPVIGLHGNSRHDAGDLRFYWPPLI